jgi:hypothetical protein
MSSPQMPINLTLQLEEGGSHGGAASVQRLLTAANLVCDHLSNGSGPQIAGAALQDEIFIVVCGHGAIRCEQGKLMEVTAGDVLYVPVGTTRFFQNLSPKFRVIRFSLVAAG